MIAIENVRLFHELQSRTQELARSVEQLRSLSEVSQAVNSTLDLQEVLSTIVKHAVQLSATDGGAIYEVDEDAAGSNCAQPMDCRRSWSRPCGPRRCGPGEGATGRAAASRAPVQIPDLRADRDPQPGGFSV